MHASRKGVSLWGKMSLLQGVRTDWRRRMKMNALGWQGEEVIPKRRGFLCASNFTYFISVHPHTTGGFQVLQN